MKWHKKHFCFLIIVIFITFIFSSCSSNNKIPVSETVSKNDFIVHYIDVGQGDSILIQVNSKNILIDAGPKASESMLSSYLKQQKINKLDYVIATHPHEDHIGGMPYVLKHIKVGVFYAPKVTLNTSYFNDMVSALKSKNLKINIAKPGINIDLGKNTTFEFLAPNSSKYDNLNNYSAVVKITYGNTKFLFMGDAQKLSEEEILQSGYDISCDVLKIGHHGSNTASSYEFLSKTSLKYAIISCGKNNEYGHPHKETLSSLSKLSCTVYRTDLNGNIVLISDGINIIKK